MQTVPESHVSTAVCGDFEPLHAANYSHGLMLCVYEEQMDSGFDNQTVRLRDLVRKCVPEAKNYEALVSL